MGSLVGTCQAIKLLAAAEDAIDCVDNILGDAMVDETILSDSGLSYRDLYPLQSKSTVPPSVGSAVSPTVYGHQYL